MSTLRHADRSPEAGRDLARACYREVTLYAPDRAPCEVDLSDNTNLWGSPPAASRTIAESMNALTRYPSLYAGALKEALAEYHALPAGSIVTGCGSDDLLDSALRACAEPGDRVAIPAPTFPMLPIFSRMNGLEPVLVPLRAARELDVEAMLSTHAAVIYLCSPNNPTGCVLDPSAIERLAEDAPGIVILDEAYADFADGDLMSLLRRHERLLVSRTFSKAFGLAGLRIGYMAGSAELVSAVEKSRGPYKVNAVAERAALATLEEDLPWVRGRVAEAIDCRERLRSELRERGLDPLTSQANFVLVSVPDAPAVAARMRAEGVAVRPFASLPFIGDALRITVAPWPLVRRCLEALDRSLIPVPRSVGARAC